MSWNTIEIRKDITPSVLRKKARCEKNGRVAARMFAIANALDGKDREFAARSGGMTRQVLRDWILRYNADGLAGLYDRNKGHTRSALSAEQLQELDALVLQGPSNGRVRWRLVDLKAEIQKRFGVAYHERSVGKILRRLNFVRLSVRPLHPDADLEAQEAFKKTSQKIWRRFFQKMPGEKRLKSGFRMKQGLDKRERSPEFGPNEAPGLA